MKPEESILVENLKEALRAAHRYIVLGVGTALFLLLLLLNDSKGVGGATEVKIPGFEMSSTPTLAAIVAMVTCFLSGLLACLTVDRIQRILSELQSSPAILKAALTYPSITTIDPNFARIAAVLLPGILALVDVIIIVMYTGELNIDVIWSAFLLAFFLAFPYIALAIELRRSLLEKSSSDDPHRA